MARRPKPLGKLDTNRGHTIKQKNSDKELELKPKRKPRRRKKPIQDRLPGAPKRRRTPVRRGGDRAV